jgi:hypothetical protein
VKTIVRAFLTVLAGFVIPGFLASPGLAQSGNVSWGPWQVRWEVNGDTAIGVRDVRFNNKTVLYRGNMPVIRVKYDRDGGQGGCGPYADRISWASLITDNNCKNNQKICQRTFSFSGRDWLEISGRAFIGSYDIIQAWYFSRDGEIQPRLFSRGLQCNINHVHHAYWQLDFDMDGSTNDEAFLHLSSFPDSGFGRPSCISQVFPIRASDQVGSGIPTNLIAAGTRQTIRPGLYGTRVPAWGFPFNRAPMMDPTMCFHR